MVEYIHRNGKPGDILFFLSSVEECETACSVLRDSVKDLDVFPLYASQSKADQDQAFKSSTKRKCVVATNVAETSLTIPGISYVIGMLTLCANLRILLTGSNLRFPCRKVERLNPRLGMSSLVSAPICKASANQRTGRAGRTNEGACIRLCIEEDFDRLCLQSTPPAIYEEDLHPLVLKLKAMGYHDLTKFDFIDKPHIESLGYALQKLYDM